MGMAQLTDTTCIQSRWIALKPTGTNIPIFGLDANLSQELDLVHVLRALLEQNKIQIYNQNIGNNGVREWYEINVQTEIMDFLESQNPQVWAPFFTLYGPQSDIPLTDEYGEPLTVLTEEGFEQYVYPSRDVYFYPTKEVDEIRIKESRVLNSQTNTYEFKPVGLSFYFKGGEYYRGHEAFWVDLNELVKALEGNTNFPWYKPIYEKQYRGFQYMQVSCYDDEIKY